MTLACYRMNVCMMHVYQVLSIHYVFLTVQYIYDIFAYRPALDLTKVYPLIVSVSAY